MEGSEGYSFVFQMIDRDGTAEDENDELGKATRRFRVYQKFTSSVVSDRLFEHYAIQEESLYILVNKNSVDDYDGYATKITNAVIQLFANH